MYPIPKQPRPPPEAEPGTGAGPTVLDTAALADFHVALKKARRIVAVLGAGLSASSGIPTFRGRGGLWCNHDITLIASPAAFRRDPGLCWQFYASRRRAMARAEPNAAHFALVELARRHQLGPGSEPGFVALTQNIDGLSARAGHPPECIKLLHGGLFDLRCCDELGCGYKEKDRFAEPLAPVLAEPEGGDDNENGGGSGMIDLDHHTRSRANVVLLAGLADKNRRILGSDYKETTPSKDDYAALKPRSDSMGKDKNLPPPATIDIAPASHIDPKDLPHCPKCKSQLLRPDVVWFGEALPVDVVEEVDAMFEDESKPPIDLCLVIGTSGLVWPAAGYSLKAREKGARVAVINMNPDDARHLRTGPGGDWLFAGDAAQIVPRLLEPLIGPPEEWAKSGEKGEEDVRN